MADPPNIIIAADADIGFLDFMLNTAPVALMSMGVLFVALYVWFRNRVTAAPENRAAILARDANSAITDKRLLIKSAYRIRIHGRRILVTRTRMLGLHTLPPPPPAVSD